MSKVVHTIKGIRYWYEHIRVGGKVVCRYIGRVDDGGRDATTKCASDATRLSNSPDSSYSSQEELDNEVRRAYTQGYGIRRVQHIFEELDLHPSRRDVENYIKNDLGMELRKRTAPVQNTPSKDTESELKQVKESLVLEGIERDSKATMIDKIEASAVQDAAEIGKLKEKLRYYRDIGRAPTDAEIEELIR